MTAIVSRGGAEAALVGPTVPGARREYLAFLAGDETFGLPLEVIREILRPMPITRVPRAPAAIAGITSVRGRITTVIDLRLILQAAATRSSTRWSRLLLIDLGDEVVAGIVDRVIQVYRFDPSEIEAADDIGAPLPGHVVGVARPREERGGRHASSVHDMVVLLDPEVLLRRGP